MGRVEGKVAIITGGASGFGAATAKLLVKEGAKVVATDKNLKGVQALAEAVTGVTAMAHDVRQEADWACVVADTVKLHGGVNILMNNAGVYGSGAPQDIENISLEEWRFVNDVNMDGVMLGCRAVIPAMARSGGGSIVNISSIAGIRGTAHIVAYGASKGAVRQLTSQWPSIAAARATGSAATRSIPAWCAPRSATTCCASTGATRTRAPGNGSRACRWASSARSRTSPTRRCSSPPTKAVTSRRPRS